MTHGGLPGRRPDQHDQPTPRVPVPGARTTPVVNKPGTTITVLQGGAPGMASPSVTGAGAQPPTTFFTFSRAGFVWGAHLSFAADTNGAYAAASQRLYAQVKLLTLGFVICTIELLISAPNQIANGDGDPSFPGLAVAAGEKIQLDVNNNVGIGGGNGLLSASTVVFVSQP